MDASPRLSVRTFLPILVAALLSVAIYAPLLGHAFIWDDYVQISENPAVTKGVPAYRYFVDRTTTSTRTDYNTRIYRPLRNWVMHGVWKLGGAAPAHRTWFFHGMNLALYLLGSWLVFALVLLVGKDPWAASLATALWLLMPVHAEDVLYASALGDLLSMVLQLGGLCYVVRALAPSQSRPTREVIAALVTFTLSLFAKEMAITSVLLVPAYILSERREQLRTRRGLCAALVLGHAGLGLGYLSLRTLVLERLSQADASSAKLVHAIVHLPWLVMLNLRVALQPLGHSPDYGPHLRGAFGTIVGAIAFFALGAYCLRSARRGLRFGALVFFLVLLPVLQIAPIWTLLADRFLLVPSVGLAMIAASLLLRVPAHRQRIVAALVAVLGLIEAGGLWIERARFVDDAHFWAYAVEVVPDSQISHHNLGLMFLQRGDPARALEHLREAYLLGRRHPSLTLYIAAAFEGLGRLDEAAEAAREAIAADPSSGVPWAQLASIQRGQHDLSGAERSLAEAQARGDAEPQILRVRAALLYAQGKLSEALRDYTRITELASGDLPSWAARGQLALQLGRRSEAEAAAKRCGTLPGCVALQRSLAQ